MKKTYIICIAFFLCAALAGTAAINAFFPQAEPIALPESDIISLSISENGTAEKEIPVADAHKLFQNIAEARPTRKMSVNDYPAAGAYYTVKAGTAERMFYYFIYEEGRAVYIEMPYEGIYKSNPDFLNSLSVYFQ